MPDPIPPEIGHSIIIHRNMVTNRYQNQQASVDLKKGKKGRGEIFGGKMVRIKERLGETAYKIPREPAEVVRRLPRDQEVMRRSSIAFMTEHSS